MLERTGPELNEELKSWEPVSSFAFIHAFLYKNTLYKNVHDENGQKIKNMLRTSQSWNLATNPKRPTPQWFAWMREWAFLVAWMRENRKKIAWMRELKKLAWTWKSIFLIAWTREFFLLTVFNQISSSDIKLFLLCLIICFSVSCLLFHCFAPMDSLSL